MSYSVIQSMLCRLFLLLVSCTAGASEMRLGPAVADFGPYYRVPAPDFLVPMNQELKVVFDVGKSSGDADKPNGRLVTLARYLNMHADVGVPKENMSTAVVVHGAAALNLLKDDAFEAQFLTKNPNRALVEQLMKAGVQVILCGQTAAFRGIKRDELIPGVQMSLSALTALISLQGQGYGLIAF